VTPCLGPRTGQAGSAAACDPLGDSELLQLVADLLQLLAQLLCLHFQFSPAGRDP